MTPNEKKISFLNRYFVFKKISHVNAEKIALESMDETLAERKKVKKLVSEKATETYKKPEKTLEKSKKAKPLNKKILLLSTASEVIDESPIIEEEPVSVPAPVSVPVADTKAKKPRAKKLNFVLDTEVKEDAANPPNLENETKPVSVQPTEVTIIKESETPVPTTKAKKVSSKKKVTLKLEE
jgi:hypothetical protein